MPKKYTHPNGANSTLIVSLYECSAAFVDAYTHAKGYGITPDTLPKFAIRASPPDATSSGTKALTMRMAPKTLVLNIACTFARSRSAAGLWPSATWKD